MLFSPAVVSLRAERSNLWVTGDGFVAGAPLFAALSVLEVGRYDGARVSIWRLASNTYVECADSLALPTGTGEALARFITEGAQLNRPVWLRRVRKWIQQCRA